MNSVRRKLDAYEREVFGHDSFHFNWACLQVLNDLGLTLKDWAKIREDLRRIADLHLKGEEGEPEPLTYQFVEVLRKYL